MSVGESSKERVRQFRARLDDAKRSLGAVDFRWYSRDILANVPVLEELAAQADLTFREMAAGQPLLDIGCADGHLSYYLESRSDTRSPVDNPATGDGLMRGVRALKRALGSWVEIIEADVDRSFDRAGWDVRAVTGRGNRVDSDPASIRGDERIYCLLSRKTLFTSGRLLDGWYPPDGERSGWRWTQRRFAAEFFVPPPARQSSANQLELDLFVPDAHAPTVVASAGGTRLADISPAPGRHRWRFALPAASAERVRVEFDVSGRLPTGQDPRPLGVVVGQLHLRTTPLRAS